MINSKTKIRDSRIYTRLIARGRLRLGFFASPAAIWERVSAPITRGVELPTYGYNFRPNERKSGLGHHSPPAQESTFRATDTVILDEGARVLPVSETETIMIWSPLSSCKYEVGYVQNASLPPRSSTIPKMISPVIVMTLMELFDLVSDYSLDTFERPTQR